MKKARYIIKTSCDHDEAFCEWLNANGHYASVGSDTGNYVDNLCILADDDANKIFVDLWNQYTRFRWDIYHGLNLGQYLKKDPGGYVVYNDDHKQGDKK